MKWSNGCIPILTVLFVVQFFQRALPLDSDQTPFDWTEASPHSGETQDFVLCRTRNEGTSKFI